LGCSEKEDVDARVKPGHDDVLDCANKKGGPRAALPLS
jgi:hypothetical protein